MGGKIGVVVVDLVFGKLFESYGGKEKLLFVSVVKLIMVFYVLDILGVDFCF